MRPVEQETLIHVPVLFQESIHALAITPDGIYVDGTLGGAGHASAIADQLSARGTFIGCDVDHDALSRAQERLASYPCTRFLIHDNFRNLGHILDRLEIPEVHGILLDLGWSSFQMSDRERGLSFMQDGPLDMNLSKGIPGEHITAYDIINFWEETTLADIFFGYGDEPKARKIARQIIEERQVRPIATTFELRDLVVRALFPKHVAEKKSPYFKIHPATKVFQALRIAVNDELQTLTDAIHVGIGRLARNGRFAIITFHSGEDRIVKNLFKLYVEQGLAELVVKKPIVPSDAELADNPRARSAKLRIIKKI